MQISEWKFYKSYPPQDVSPGLCGYAGVLGLAVRPKNGKKWIWKLRGVAKSDGEKSEYGYETLEIRFSPYGFATPFHFQIVTFLKFSYEICMMPFRTILRKMCPFFPMRFGILRGMIFAKKNVNSGKGANNFHQNSSRAAFASQSFHEITMNYAMRSIYAGDLELIHNINFNLPFPIDQDFYLSAEFQEILKSDSDWWSTLDNYYYRPEFELFNISSKREPFEAAEERTNLAKLEQYRDILEEMKKRLQKWQWETFDPWRCAPRAILQDSGRFKENPKCFKLNNEL